MSTQDNSDNILNNSGRGIPHATMENAMISYESFASGRDVPPPPPPLSFSPHTERRSSYTPQKQYNQDTEENVTIQKESEEILDYDLLKKKYDLMKKEYIVQLEHNYSLNNEMRLLNNNCRTLRTDANHFSIENNELRSEIMDLKKNKNVKTNDKINNDTKYNNQVSIENLLEENRLEDLERFLNRRKCLNKWNIYMIYFFHLIQSSGILLSSVGASLNYPTLLWAGIGLNTFASIIQIFEKVNDAQLKRMYRDIVSIKDNKYICEIEAIDSNNLNQTYAARSSTTRRQ